MARRDVLAAIGVRQELPTRFVIPAGGFGATRNSALTPGSTCWRARPSGSTYRPGSARVQGWNARAAWSSVITSTRLKGDLARLSVNLAMPAEDAVAEPGGVG
jgi:hypothetical protein